MVKHFFILLLFILSSCASDKLVQEDFHLKDNVDYLFIDLNKNNIANNGEVWESVNIELNYDYSKFEFNNIIYLNGDTLNLYLDNVYVLKQRRNHKKLYSIMRNGEYLTIFAKSKKEKILSIL